MKKWKPKLGDKVVRHPRLSELAPIHMTVSNQKKRSPFNASPLTLAYAFLGLIMIGSIILILPIAHYDSGYPIITAIFTATSAVTVTGLTVVDTPTYWTKFGQIIILILIFLGGLGFMTLATFLLTLFGQRVSVNQRLLMLRETSGNEFSRFGGVGALAIRLVILIVILQLIGFMLFSIRFVFFSDIEDPWWQSIFLAISGFNNAGFTITQNSASLSIFQTDRFITSILTGLTILGGLSYWVIMDLISKKRFGLYSLNTKIIITLTGILLLVGFTTHFILEYSNPLSIGNLDVIDKATNSFFVSATLRSAGFATYNFADSTMVTKMISLVLMFIGGAPSSVAGGIKITTFVILIALIYSVLKKTNHAKIFGREILESQIRKAITLILLALSFLVIATILLSIIESKNNIGFFDLFFDLVSAFVTCGSSMGVTSSFSPLGQLFVSLVMFVGRVIPITIIILLSPPNDIDLYRFPTERVPIG